MNTGTGERQVIEAVLRFIFFKTETSKFFPDRFSAVLSFFIPGNDVQTKGRG